MIKRRIFSAFLAVGLSLNCIALPVSAVDDSSGFITNKEFENHIKIVPYITNSILSTLSNVKTLSKMTDIIASQIPITIDRKKEYLFEIDPKIRAQMILEDIYREEEMFKIEKEIDAKVKKDLDDNQKE